MTQITIPCGSSAQIRIPEKPVQTEPMPIERIGVSAEVASKMVGVSVRTMWNLAKKERVRTIRIGTRVIFSVQSLREFIDGKIPCDFPCQNADKPDIACVAEGKERE